MLQKFLDKLRILKRKNGILLDALECYVRDARRYLKFSTTLTLPTTLEPFFDRITSHYHSIEKGLSFKNIKILFGEEVIASLFLLMEEYKRLGYPLDKTSFVSGVKAVSGYIAFNERNGQDVYFLKFRLSEILKPLVPDHDGANGVVEITKDDFIRSTKGDFKELALGRHSIRNFTAKEVEIEQINRAINLAQRSPSACNRQSVSIYLVSDSILIKKALELQNGNHGFGHLINKLLVVVADVQNFEGVRERNQVFIDAGLFSMSLLYALQYESLGTCPLNWCAVSDNDKRLRKLLDIKESEVVTMMIGVGHLPDKFFVAASCRKNLQSIINTR